ncbi:MAG: ABC transporter substrate-binding protein [Xanthobacteraceae bacterium]|nr:ABC transporter substrate-binding protein [Xanthobacteraceae bacterium]
MLLILAALGGVALLQPTCASAAGGAIVPLIDRPAPLSTRQKLRIGVLRISYTVVVQRALQILKDLNVDAELIEFVRYADARTALASGSIDVGTLGPGDIAISLTQGVTNIVGLTGLGSAHRWVVAKVGVEIKDWQDLCSKRLGLPTGSDTWVRFSAKLLDEGIPYGSLTVTNIQGSQQNSLQALRRGEVDAIVTWEPAESQAVLEGIGYWSKNLDFADAGGTGPEIGMIAASRAALNDKPEAMKRFAWAYLAAQNDLAGDRALLVKTMEEHAKVDERLATSMTENLTLGGVLTADQVARHAKVMYDLGILLTDVSERARSLFDESLFVGMRRDRAASTAK